MVTGAGVTFAADCTGVALLLRETLFVSFARAAPCNSLLLSFNWLAGRTGLFGGTGGGAPRIGGGPDGTKPGVGTGRFSCGFVELTIEGSSLGVSGAFVFMIPIVVAEVWPKLIEFCSVLDIACLAGVTEATFVVLELEAICGTVVEVARTGCTVAYDELLFKLAAGDCD